MGTFFQAMTVRGPTAEITVDALVDTGAPFSSLPASVLTALGVEPQRTVRLRLADGSSHLQPLGTASIAVDGVENLAPIIFGEEGSTAVIGAVTLKILLLGVDTAAQKLVPVDGWSA